MIVLLLIAAYIAIGVAVWFASMVAHRSDARSALIDGAFWPLLLIFFICVVIGGWLASRKG